MTGKNMSKNLSKSKYLSGLQCEKRLWLEINDPGKASETSEYQQRLFDQKKKKGKKGTHPFLTIKSLNDLPNYLHFYLAI